MRRTLSVDLGGIVLPTPVVVGAGCAGTGKELAAALDQRKVGAIVSRSVTVEPRKGSPTPRIAESPSGIVWDTGLQNPGVEAFVGSELPALAKGGAHVFVSIAGDSLEDYVRLTTALQGRPEVTALEVYLSGPDREVGRDVLGAHVDRAIEIVGAVARMSLIPVFAKLPASTELVTVAEGCVRAGAHGLTLLGPPPALAIAAGRLAPELGGVVGWLGGPALKPLTLRAVLELSRALPDVPIMAAGGVRTGLDAVECLLAGASAVQVGTAMLLDPAAPVAIAQDIARYLSEKNLTSPADVRARLRLPVVAAPRAGGEEA
jgi:dihydroorotate dehydrogenase (NAD+) catalytic subunit